MKAAIRKQAAELGFDDCRFTTAQPPQSAPDLERWLAQGRQGEMAYMQRNAHRRVNPQRVLAGARSIITLAVSYGEEQEPEPGIHEGAFPLPLPFSPRRGSHAATPALPGVVARYARYEDYHNVIGARLQPLVEFINDLGGPTTRWLWYLDTA